MKKILFVIPFLSSGGAERVVSIWSSEMAKLGVDVHSLVFYRVENEYKIDEKVVLHTIKNNRQEYEQLSNKEKITSIRRILKELKPDVVLPFITHVGLMVSIARIGLPVKMIETIRIDPKYSPPQKIKRGLRNLSVFFAHRCIVQNKDQLAYFPKWMQKRIQVFANPISNEVTENEKVFLEKSIKSIVAVGRLEKQKNYYLLIQAFSKVIEDYKELNLKIYGEGSLYAELNDLIGNLNLQDQITLCGRTNDIPGVLKQADLYIMSSDAEGMPNALMEAMAIGLPCISTDCPTGPADLIKNGENGYLIPVDDQPALENAMREMIANSDKAIEMGKNARNTILSKFAARASAKSLIEYINRI